MNTIQIGNSRISDLSDNRVLIEMLISELNNIQKRVDFMEETVALIPRNMINF